jgi:WD40 repeat protein
MSWAKNLEDQPVFWLNGLAGTGKSTIAQTFSEMASNDDILGASFFCSRDYLDRKELKNIFPTLGYQLACRYPRFRDHLVKSIKRDPSVAHNSLISQLRALVVDPLSAAGISCVIVIDALDECIDDQPASAILSVLGRLVGMLPLVKFFITGRPEPRIRSGFRLPLLEPFTQIFLLHEVASASVEGDIRLYLTEKLGAMAKRRSGLDLPEAWPSDEDITVLARKSSGLFIFASTVARFIESEHHEPRERLRLIVNKADDTSHEGASGIDSLYSQVLRDAFSGVNEESVFVHLRRILSAVVLALNPLSRDGLTKLLNIDSALISTTLRHLHSVILVPADGSEKIRVFHKSFPDFLQDSDRCPDPRFYIDSPARHVVMVLGCLDLMGKLKMNPCLLPPFVMNQDIPDPPQLLEDRLGSGLRYACKYWSTHLLLSSTSREYHNWLVASMSRFFEHSVLPWMEVMSLESRLEDVIHSMNHMLDWLSNVSCIRSTLRRWHRLLTMGEPKVGIANGPLSDLTTDCLRFTLHFFRPIQMSAQHIYHTALPLSPETSFLRQQVFGSNSGEDWTTRQAPSSSLSARWGGVLRTIKAESGRFTHVTVAGQRIAAVCEDNTVNVYDAVTGVLRLTLRAPQRVTKVAGSSDGSILFCAHQRFHEITLWDMQTGGLIHTFTTKSEVNDIVISSTGRYLGSSFDGTFEFWDVEGRCEGSRFSANRIVCACWLEPEDHVALGFKKTVVVLEITTGKTLHTFPVDTGLHTERVGIAYSAGQHRLAVLVTSETRSRIVIIDIRTGLTSVWTLLPDVVSFAFSSNGDQVVCASGTGDLRFFNPTIPTPQWYNFPGYLELIYSISLLRSGHLVVNSGDSIQLLATEYAQPPSSSADLGISQIYSLDNGRAISVSPNSRPVASLLDMETMKTLAEYSIGLDGQAPWRIICASVDRSIAILTFQRALKMQVIGSVSPKWEQPLSNSALSGALSPDGEKFITVAREARGWKLCVRRVSDGEILGFILQRAGAPKDASFTSDTQFYVEYEVRDHVEGALVLAAASASSGVQFNTKHRHAARTIRITFTLTPGFGILELERSDPPASLYRLDENLEWVVDAKSRRVCWLPPGYISGIEDGYFFVGSSIVMAGEDGILRKLTFREPRSDS